MSRKEKRIPFTQDMWNYVLLKKTSDVLSTLSSNFTAYFICTNTDNNKKTPENKLQYIFNAPIIH